MILFQKMAYQYFEIKRFGGKMKKENMLKVYIHDSIKISPFYSKKKNSLFTYKKIFCEYGFMQVFIFLI